MKPTDDQVRQAKIVFAREMMARDIGKWSIDEDDIMVIHGSFDVGAVMRLVLEAVSRPDSVVGCVPMESEHDGRDDTGW